MHVDDLSGAIHKIINSKSQNNIFNIGAGKAESILDLKNIISHKRDHIFLEKRNDDIEISISNINKIKKRLFWKPKISFKNGVKEIEKLDKMRLLRFNLPSVKQQQKLIKKFNKKK